MDPKSEKTLSNEELAVLAANGDDKSMAKLIAIITPVAKAKANDFAGARISDEDLVQEGMMGFLDAVRSFDISKGTPFKSYAETCINNRMLSAVRENLNYKNSALSKAVPYDAQKDDRSDTAIDPANIMFEKYEAEYLGEIIRSTLSDFERQVVYLRFLEKSYSEIAKLLDCSEKAVDNALLRARKKMREKLD